VNRKDKSGRYLGAHKEKKPVGINELNQVLTNAVLSSIEMGDLSIEVPG